MHEQLLPEGWPRPKGYSNGIAAEGRLLVMSGQFGWDAQERLVSPDYVPQAIKALENIAAVLREGSARPHDLVRLTWYITDREAYRLGARDVGMAYREIIGAFPAMSAFLVAGLMVDGAKVQIEATAVVPNQQVPH